MAHVRLFAAAAEACSARELEVEASSVAELVLRLEERGDDAARVVRQCALLVDGVRRDDGAFPLEAGAKVDVLPPFAGG